MPAADITVSAIVPATTPVAVLAGAGAVAVLLAALLVLRRRRRHARATEAMLELLPEVDPSLAIGVDSPDGAVGGPGRADQDQPEAAPEGVRALRLLVRTLESTIEEQQAELARLRDTEVERPSTPALPDAWAFDAPDSEVETVEDRRARTVAHALREVPAEDRAARLNAALARTGTPISFTRPVLAACPGVPLPDSAAPVAAAPTAVAEPAVPTRPTLVPQPEPMPEPAHLEDASPVEAQRVLPVPAPPAAAEAPRRRRLFRSTAA